VTDTGALNSTSTSNSSLAAKTLIDAINAVAATNFGTGANVGLVSPLGSGYQSPVTRVGIGQKLDHMESRERDIPEAHTFQNTVTSLLLNEQLDDEFRDAMRDAYPDAVLS
jgi:hypothetical protein